MSNKKQIRKHIFVCINGECGSAELSKEISKKFKAEIKARNMKDVVVSESNCLGICEDGPLLVIYPEGKWFFNIRLDDISKIIEENVV